MTPIDTIFSSTAKKKKGFRCILTGAVGFQIEVIVPTPQPRAVLGIWHSTLGEFAPTNHCQWQVIYQGYAGSCTPPAERVADSSIFFYEG